MGRSGKNDVVVAFGGLAGVEGGLGELAGPTVVGVGVVVVSVHLVRSRSLLRGRKPSFGWAGHDLR